MNILQAKMACKPQQTKELCPGNGEGGYPPKSRARARSPVRATRKERPATATLVSATATLVYRWKMLSFSKIELPVAGMNDLAAEARSQGYRFLERLEREWSTGANRFSGPGEALYAAFVRSTQDAPGQLIAVAGLNRDPFLDDPGICRLRRVYVRAAWRDQGIGRALIAFILADARSHFRSIRLRAENHDAARLYERLGFEPIPDANATHILHLAPKNEPTHESPP
jgi:GNAT superfamily N-acetyltransferase